MAYDRTFKMEAEAGLRWTMVLGGLLLSAFVVTNLMGYSVDYTHGSSMMTGPFTFVPQFPEMVLLPRHTAWSRVLDIPPFLGLVWLAVTFGKVVRYIRSATVIGVFTASVAFMALGIDLPQFSGNLPVGWEVSLLIAGAVFSTGVVVAFKDDSYEKDETIIAIILPTIGWLLGAALVFVLIWGFPATVASLRCFAMPSMFGVMLGSLIGVSLKVSFFLVKKIYRGLSRILPYAVRLSTYVTFWRWLNNE